MKRIISLCLAFPLLLSGCGEIGTKVPVEKTDLIGVLGFDYLEDDNYKLIAAIPQNSPEAEEKTQIFTVNTDIITKGIVEIESSSDKKVALNQLRVVLISEEFASHDGKLREVIHHLYRNPQVSTKVIIAIVKGDTEELLSGNYSDKPGIINYLAGVLRPSINTAFNPNTTIHDFMYTDTNPNFDPIVPVIEMKEGKIEVVGVALFKDEKMVKVVNPDDSLIIQALQGRKKLSALTLNISNEEKVLIDLIDNKIKILSNKSFENPEVTIKVKIDGSMIEFKGNSRFNTPASIKKLEKEIDKSLKKRMNKFLKELQELQVDPIGLTENIRRHHKGEWTKEMTRETIARLKWDIQVETTVKNTGILK